MLEARPVNARPHLELAPRLQPPPTEQKRSGILFIGETTIFHKLTAGTDDRERLASLGSRTLTREEFVELPLSADRTDQTVSNPGFHIGRRITRIGQGPFTLFTWGNQAHTTFLEKQIGQEFRNMDTQIKKADGNIREAVVFQSGENHRAEMITIDTPSSMNSDFADVINGKQNHVIIGSLPEGKWRESLSNGLRKLQHTHTSYSVILGETYRNAVIARNESAPIYDAIEKTTALVVTIEDLRHLIKKHKTPEKPSDNFEELINQAKRLLKSEFIFVAAGREGFIGGSREGDNRYVYADRTGDTVSDEDYMNAFIAGVVMDGDLETRLVRGSANVSILVNPEGDFNTLPSQKHFDRRVTRKFEDLRELSQINNAEL